MTFPGKVLSTIIAAFVLLAHSGVGQVRASQTELIIIVTPTIVKTPAGDEANAPRVGNYGAKPRRVRRQNNSNK